MWLPTTILYDQVIMSFSLSRRRQTTYASGRITAQSVESTCHPTGTSDVLSISIPAKVIVHIISATRKRFKILGTSIKKFDRSTSFFVAPHVML
jgi:hypothetical protein